jgi:hypothetical protein
MEEGSIQTHAFVTTTRDGMTHCRCHLCGAEASYEPCKGDILKAPLPENWLHPMTTTSSIEEPQTELQKLLTAYERKVQINKLLHEPETQ